MPSTATAQRHEVPLTRFLNNTAEVLDLALKVPVTLTRHGRPQWTIAETAYFDRLEMLAAGKVLAALDRQHLSSVDLSEDMARRIAAQMPSTKEIVRDRWNHE